MDRQRSAYEISRATGTDRPITIVMFAGTPIVMVMAAGSIEPSLVVWGVSGHRERAV